MLPPYFNQINERQELEKVWLVHSSEVYLLAVHENNLTNMLYVTYFVKCNCFLSILMVVP